MSRSAPVSPLSIASRVLAAVVGGYTAAYATTAFLAIYLPLARPDRVVFSSLASFAVWTAVVIYVFAARDQARLWMVLVGLCAVLGLAAWLAGDWSVRP